MPNKKSNRSLATEVPDLSTSGDSFQNYRELPMGGASGQSSDCQSEAESKFSDRGWKS
ncbi:hypothetical protein PO909_030438 [Leuciscus waleckii]